MDQDPAPYLEMKRYGATAADVYRKARGDGFKNYECLVLIMGVFGLELDEARKIGHQAFYHERDSFVKNFTLLNFKILISYETKLNEYFTQE